MKQFNYNTILILFLLLSVFQAHAQYISGKSTVCNNETVEYSYTGNTSGCFYRWAVTGGYFTDYPNSQPQDVSKVKVTWTNGAGGTVRVIGCTDGNLNVTINDFNLNLTPASVTIQSGSSVNLFASGASTYSWSCNRSSCFLNTTTGATVTASPSSTTTYTVTGKIGSCSKTKSATVTVNTTQAISNNTISSNVSPTCASVNPYLTGSVPTGGNGSFTYQWQSNLNNINGSTWTNISGATSKDYDPPVTTQTTYFRRVVYSGTIAASISNVVEILIYPPVTNNEICCNQIYESPTVPEPILSNYLNSGAQTYFCQWESSHDGIVWNNYTENIQYYYNDESLVQLTLPMIYETTYFRRKINDGRCPTTISNPVKITINNPVPLGGSFDNPIPAGEFIAQCKRFIHSVNSTQPGYVNSIGGPAKDVFYKFTIAPGETHVLLDFSTCRSDVDTKLYLLDANGNILKSADNGTGSDYGCFGRFRKILQANMDYQFGSYPNYPGGTYYLVVEGDGELKTEIAMILYSDCVDNYLNDDNPPFPGGGDLKSPTDVLANSEFNDGYRLYTEGTGFNLLFEDTKEPAVISVYNFRGKLVKRSKVTDMKEGYTITSLPEGLYIINIEQGKRTKRLKFSN